MSWLYVQRTGELFHGTDCYGGYSGHADGRNCPAMQGVKGVGPVPCGTYTMGGVHSSSQTGPLSICLRPDATTRAFILSLGRDPDSFLMHGDNAEHNASHGCLIFSRPTRLLVALAISAIPPDAQLQVAADLPT